MLQRRTGSPVGEVYDGGGRWLLRRSDLRHRCLPASTLGSSRRPVDYFFSSVSATERKSQERNRRSAMAAFKVSNGRESHPRPASTGRLGQGAGSQGAGLRPVHLDAQAARDGRRDHAKDRVWHHQPGRSVERPALRRAAQGVGRGAALLVEKKATNASRSATPSTRTSTSAGHRFPQRDALAVDAANPAHAPWYAACKARLVEMMGDHDIAAREDVRGVRFRKDLDEFLYALKRTAWRRSTSSCASPKGESEPRHRPRRRVRRMILSR